MVGVRMTEEFQAPIKEWASRQTDTPPLADAIRRLVELGLTVKPKARPRADSQKQRAKEMAAKAIDNLADAGASVDDQAGRQRRLLKGPEEFQDMRIDRAEAKK